MNDVFAIAIVLLLVAVIMTIVVGFMEITLMPSRAKLEAQKRLYQERQDEKKRKFEEAVKQEMERLRNAAK